jgi:hypothetical protein
MAHRSSRRTHQITTTAVAGVLLLLIFGQQEVSPFIYFQF